jgi:hypothetical protein
MVRAFAERVDLNWGPHPGNIVAPESTRYVESLRMTSRAIEGRPERRGYRQPLGAWVIMESLADRVMIIGVDRLDYSNGTALRMEAFDRFLSTRSDWRQR